MIKVQTRVVPSPLTEIGYKVKLALPQSRSTYSLFYNYTIHSQPCYAGTPHHLFDLPTLTLAEYMFYPPPAPPPPPPPPPLNVVVLPKASFRH